MGIALPFSAAAIQRTWNCEADGRTAWIVKVWRKAKRRCHHLSHGEMGVGEEAGEGSKSEIDTA